MIRWMLSSRPFCWGERAVQLRKKRDDLEEDRRECVPARFAPTSARAGGQTTRAKREGKRREKRGEERREASTLPQTTHCPHINQEGSTRVDLPRTPRPSACPSSRTHRPCPRGRGAAPRACSTPTRSSRCSPSDGTPRGTRPSIPPRGRRRGGGGGARTGARGQRQGRGRTSFRFKRQR